MNLIVRKSKIPSNFQGSFEICFKLLCTKVKMRELLLIKFLGGNVYECYMCGLHVAVMANCYDISQKNTKTQEETLILENSSPGWISLIRTEEQKFPSSNGRTCCLLPFQDFKTWMTFR